jgi:hypothetical protein
MRGGSRSGECVVARPSENAERARFRARWRFRGAVHRPGDFPPLSRGVDLRRFRSVAWIERSGRDAVVTPEAMIRERRAPSTRWLLSAQISDRGRGRQRAGSGGLDGRVVVVMAQTSIGGRPNRLSWRLPCLPRVAVSRTRTGDARADAEAGPARSGGFGVMRARGRAPPAAAARSPPRAPPC